MAVSNRNRSVKSRRRRQRWRRGQWRCDERRPAASTCWSPAPAMSAWPPPCRSSRRGPSLAVAIVDAAPAGAWQQDGRASAIAAAACRMLDQLGCWDEIAPQAQPITEMIVTDSRTSDPVRPVFLTFDGEVGAGRALRAHGRQHGAERRACAGARPNSASTSSKASRSPPSRPAPAAITVQLADGVDARGAAAGRRRRRQLEAARHGRHQDGALGIRPVGHRLHRGA